MAYLDNYKLYLDKVPNDIKKCVETGNRYVMGYTSNLDVIIEWDAAIFNELLSKYLVSEPSAKEGDIIDSMENFASIVSYYAMYGLGGEAEITNIEVCQYLEKYFKTKFSIGGTCIQGAAALDAVGFPVIAHITDRCKELCSMLSNSKIYLIGESGLKPIKDMASDLEPIRHMILQYSKGNEIIINNSKYSVPLSNRIIMDYDKVHKNLPVDKEFIEFCESNADKIYSYNISGFNAIVDEDIITARLDELSGHYENVKNKNPNCIIYLESAHYLNSKCKVMVFKKLSKYIDILGMNEEELLDLLGQLNITVNTLNLESILKGLDRLVSEYEVRGIVMHTKDYSMYYGNDIPEVDVEKGLTLGNLFSGTRARTGRYGSLEDCYESLKLPLSEIGVEFANDIESIKCKMKACIVPSRYMENPVCTIGLGDTFTAGFQICFSK